MVKAVFTTKVHPTYDDLPEERYHFPKRYLDRVKETVGDLIVYYEPRRRSGDLSDRGGRQTYFAVARVTDLVQDPNRSDHFYALVSDFLQFTSDVPFRDGEHFFESALMKEDGSTNKGAFGNAVRWVPEEQFEAICRVGFGASRSYLGRDETHHVAYGFADEPDSSERPILQQVVSRPFRDNAFATTVRAAYDSTCAITGIQLFNSKGNAEMHAAHIRPVGGPHRGTDSVRNGIALCRTAHWMFDEGLISFSDDYEVMFANRTVERRVSHFCNGDGRLSVPDDPALRPHQKFLSYHRDVIFSP